MHSIFSKLKYLILFWKNEYQCINNHLHKNGWVFRASIETIYQTIFVVTDKSFSIILWIIWSTQNWTFKMKTFYLRLIVFPDKTIQNNFIFSPFFVRMIERPIHQIKKTYFSNMGSIYIIVCVKYVIC